jgi:hypothetical protein
LVTVGETVSLTAEYYRFRLKLRIDFGHPIQDWLAPFPVSLIESECLLVSINAFLDCSKSYQNFYEYSIIQFKNFNKNVFPFISEDSGI